MMIGLYVGVVWEPEVQEMIEVQFLAGIGVPVHEILTALYASYEFNEMSTRAEPLAIYLDNKPIWSRTT